MSQDLNLKGLRERVCNEMKFNPNSQQYRDDVDTVLNDIEQELCASAQWQFLEKIADLNVYADAEMTYDSDTAGRYLLTEVTPTPSEYFEGHTFETTGGQTFEISRVDVDNEQMYPVSGQSPTSSDPDQSTGYVRFYRYLLPPDCVEPLGIMDRNSDRGEIPLIDRTQERRLVLNPDDTGEPQVWLPDYIDPVRAGRSAFTLTVNVLPGDFPAGTYRYLIARRVGGRYSAPSAVVSATVPDATSQNIEIGNVYEEGNNWEPYHIFRDDGDGRFRRLEGTDGTPARVTGVNFTDDYSYSLSEYNLWYEEDRIAIRFWPRPATDATYELRYLVRPRRMQTDNDCPIIPVPYRKLLMHRAIAQICARTDAGSALGALHARLADEMESRMKKRYLDNKVQQRQRREWSAVGGRLRRQANVVWLG